MVQERPRGRLRILDQLEHQTASRLSIPSNWLKLDVTNACRVDDGVICEADGSPVGGLRSKPVEMGRHMNSGACVCNPVRLTLMGHGSRLAMYEYRL